jgi:uncharacterized membrane protein YhaH (DUF805 family)
MLRFYTSFVGRTSRRDYWWRFYLPFFALGLVASILDMLMVADTALRDAQGDALPLPGALSLTLWVVSMWPTCAVTTKRLHDRGKSGWSMLVPFALLVGSLLTLLFGVMSANPVLMLGATLGIIVSLLFNIWLFVQIGFLPGDKGENSHGPNPLTTPSWSAAPNSGPAFDTTNAMNAIQAALRAPDEPLRAPSAAKPSPMRHQPPASPGGASGSFGKRPSPKR